MINYFCEDEWVRFESVTSMECARGIVLNTAEAPNITTPNERSVKLFSSFIACVCETDEALKVFNISVKKAMMHVLSKEFDDLQRKCKQAADFADLPADPNTLRASHPELWANAFGKRTPVKCRIEIQHKLFVFESSYKCRGGGADAKSVPAPASGGLSSSSTNLESVVGMMVQGFMQVFCQGQSSQEPLLTFNDGSNRGQAPSCLRALLGGQ